MTTEPEPIPTYSSAKTDQVTFEGLFDRRGYQERQLAQLNEQTAVESAAALLQSLPGWSEVPEDHRAKTPMRLVKMLRELTTREPFDFTVFPNNDPDSTEMIVLSPIPFYTLCAHHVVPFFGFAYIGYVPEDKIAGLSKFPRLVKWAAKGLWVQEELTTFISDEIYSKLEPKGTAVVLRAEHLCMSMRGVAQPGVVTTTSDMRGVYKEHDRLARAEFLSLAGLK